MMFLPTRFLESYINKKTNGSKFGALAMVIMFYFFSMAFYYNSSSIAMLIINNIVVAAISCAGIYSMVFVEAKNINSIIKEVEIGNDLTITTYGYRFLFFRLRPVRISFMKENLFLEEVIFPFNSKGLDKTKTICIYNNDTEFYFLYECYEEGLKAKLLSLSQV